MRIISPSGSSSYRSGWNSRVVWSSARANARATSRFPTPGRPVEEVRVRRTFAQRRLEQARRLGVLREAGERAHGSPRRSRSGHGRRRRRRCGRARRRPARDSRRRRARMKSSPARSIRSWWLAGAPGASSGSSTTTKVRSGSSAAGDEQAQLAHPLARRARGRTLVGDRRVEVAVADDVRAALERGPDHRAPRSRPGRRHRAPPPPTATSRRRGARARGCARQRGVPPGSRVESTVAALLLEPLGEHFRLGALPRPVDTFEGHEHPRP